MYLAESFAFTGSVNAIAKLLNLLIWKFALCSTAHLILTSYHIGPFYPVVPIAVMLCINVKKFQLSPGNLTSQFPGDN